MKSTPTAGSCRTPRPGTPDWYGAFTDPLRGRYWLLLERVNGPQLSQVGAFSTWERTAAWIARFHGAFSPLRAQQLAKRSGVFVYDEAFYWRWMRRAQRFAEGDPRSGGSSTASPAATEPSWIAW